MTLQTIIDIIREDGGSWLVMLIIVTSLVQVSPIKINPWSYVARKLGQAFSKDIVDRVIAIEKKLDDHITESNARDVRLRRETILDFANSCMNKRKHTKEEFDFIIGECDKYEKYCADNNIQNGVADASIEEVKRIYKRCLAENSFLQISEEE